MEFHFDNETYRSNAAETRIYDPTGRKRQRGAASDAPVPVRLRQSEDDALVERPRSQIRFSELSKIMVLISVFLIALTALLSLFGAAEYARISSEIETINSDIETYEQQISQVKKTQSAMNDYSSITDACLDRGMQMIWEPDVFGSNP